MIDSNDTLFAQLATVLYCLASIEPDTRWPDRLAAIVAAHPVVTLSPMGFPSDWERRLNRTFPTTDH